MKSEHRCARCKRVCEARFYYCFHCHEALRRRKTLAKIYYTIDTATRGYPVCWTDRAGQQHIEKLNLQNPDPGQVNQEFRKLHPGAIYLANAQMSVYLEKLKADRERLKSWIGEGK